MCFTSSKQLHRASNQLIKPLMPLLWPAVLAGAAALHHHIVQLLAVKDDGEEVDLSLWLGLGLLQAPTQQQHAIVANAGS